MKEIANIKVKISLPVFTGKSIWFLKIHKFFTPRRNSLRASPLPSSWEWVVQNFRKSSSQSEMLAPQSRILVILSYKNSANFSCKDFPAIPLPWSYYQPELMLGREGFSNCYLKNHSKFPQLWNFFSILSIPPTPLDISPLWKRFPQSSWPSWRPSFHESLYILFPFSHRCWWPTP